MGKRKERSAEEQERRAKLRELLQLSGVSSMADIQDLFKETIAEFMEDGLDAELTEELGYSKYDYKNKETENSRNGYSSQYHVRGEGQNGLGGVRIGASSMLNWQYTLRSICRSDLGSVHISASTMRAK